MDVNSGSFEAVACKVEKNKEDTQINENLDNGQERDSDQEYPIDMEEIKVEPDDTDNTEIPDQDMIIPGFVTVYVEENNFNQPESLSIKTERNGRKNRARNKFNYYKLGQKPYTCDICFSNFSSKTYVNLHKRIHTGQKPYSCKDCSMTFRFRQAFEQHLRIHTNEKPFNCDLCSETFRQRIQLQRHELMVHFRVSSKSQHSNKKAANKRKTTTKKKKKRVVEIKTEKLAPIN
ncbi:zinc finger protein 558-like [Cotesia glomerata]|uniref:zinc finger protein 558-like n=1 Tax=Cotesia glomerata TaxID=32391 RepID=UPI001D02C38D|nr:zinc finger protein 558-like [Cotesia glomerata]